MSETFRPSTLGEILDRTAQIYRRSFLLFVGVAALPIGVIVGVTALAAAIWKAFFSSITVNNFEMTGALAVIAWGDGPCRTPGLHRSGRFLPCGTYWSRG